VKPPGTMRTGALGHSHPGDGSYFNENGGVKLSCVCPAGANSDVTGWKLTAGVKQVGFPSMMTKSEFIVSICCGLPTYTSVPEAK
jgi:hypothetical protein